MRIIVDRFEGNIAVVELPNGKTIDCPKELLPSDAKEGSIINILVDEDEMGFRFDEIIASLL